MNPEKLIDCQGLPCPQPVLKCRDILESERPEKISVLVDNHPALENVTRFLSMQGYTLDKPEKQGSNWLVGAYKKDSNAAAQDSPALQKKSAGSSNTLVFISKDKIGQGDDVLGSKLMLNFIATLPEMGDNLWKLVLVNSGVKLAIEDSPALDSLKKLEDGKVTILVCGTCLEFFGLTARKKVGQTTNMLDIISGMSLADKIISL